MSYNITQALPHQFAAIQAIERAANQLYPVADLPAPFRNDTLSLAVLQEAQQARRLWVAQYTDGTLVGFALADAYPQHAHLREVDVLPDFSRRGIGTALVQTVVAWARTKGYPTLTLTTFHHLPWNAPFYQRLGFEQLPVPVPKAELEALRQQEAEDLDLSKRVIMRLAL